MTRKDATTGRLSPGSSRAEAGTAHRRRAEIVAGAVLGALSLMVVVGWWSVPGESSLAAESGTPHPEPDQLTYTAVTGSSGTAGTVTALILGFMIFGAALIGLFFFSPTAPRLQRTAARYEILDPCL
ncbi:hypothetical protein, partial [Nocardia uniformis]